MERKISYIKIGSLLLAGLFILASSSHLCFSLPEPQEVASGTAEFVYPDASTLEIKALDKTIINYKSFDIKETESVIINLPNVNNEILNRVLGEKASEILGRLSCNGIFILVNASGIYFGPNANLDTASLIASTRDITNSDFLSSKYIFGKLSGQQMDTLLLNQGKLNIRKAGFGVLIAGAIENQGTIVAPLGTIALAGGDLVTLDISSDGLISVAVNQATASTILDQQGNPITAQIKNSGTLQADGGVVLLKAESLPGVFTHAINLEGYVRANKLEEKDGVIRIVSSGKVTLTGELSASRIMVGEVDEAIPESVEGKLSAEEYISLIAHALSVKAIAPEVRLFKTGGIEIMSSHSADDLITLEGAGMNLTYLKDSKLTLETDMAVNTSPGVIISANEVKVTAKQFGTPDMPLTIEANITHINRVQGAIEIMESQGIGTSIMLRGPPDGFGAIIYNKDTNLVLETQKGDIYLHQEVNISVPSLSLFAQGKVISYATIQTPLFYQRGESLLLAGTTIIGRAFLNNLDNAVDIAGDISGVIEDTVNINFVDNVNLLGDTTLKADSDQDQSGKIIMNGYSLFGNNYNLTLYTGEDTTLDGDITGVATLELYSSTANTKTYTSTATNFSVNTLKTNYYSVFSRDKIEDGCQMIYSVSNAPGGLQYIQNNLSGNYKLANNIDAQETINWNAGSGFAPIGDSSTNFTGTLEGAGYTILNLYIYRSSFVGLFGYVGNAAQISNVNLVNVAISGSAGYYGSVSNLGGLAGYNSGAISNSYATGNVSGSAGYYGSVSNLGVLVGFNSGTVSNSYATGNISAWAGSAWAGWWSSVSNLGGLVGYNSGTITNSYATGNVSGSAGYYGSVSNLGVLVGYNSGTISNSYAMGNVSESVTYGSSVSNLGVLVGYNSGTISNSYATGNVSGSAGYYGSVSNLGGLVGYNSGTVSNSYATGNVSGSVEYGSVSNLGGLVGYNSGTISNSYATGNVSGSAEYWSSVSNLGGLVGYNRYGTIADSYATGNVSGSGGQRVLVSNLGGLVGQDDSGSYTSNYWLKTDTHNSNLEDTGCGDIGGITNIDIVQMKQQATFISWDFISIWTIDEGYSYPYFPWQPWLWDAGGDTISWTDPFNWDRNSGYPDSNEDKVIINSSGLTITTPSNSGLTLGELMLGSGFSGTLVLGNDLSLDNSASRPGTLVIFGSSIVVDLNGHNLTLSGSFLNNGTLKLLGTEALTNFTNDIDSGTVYYYGNDPYTSLPAGNNYYNLVLSASDCIELQTDVTAYRIDAYANNGITVNSSLTTTGSDDGHIYFNADSNGDGIGTFTQATGSTISTTGTGSSNYIYIYAGDGITLNGSVTTSGTDNNYIYLNADWNGDGTGSFTQGTGTIIQTTGSSSYNYITIYAGNVTGSFTQAQGSVIQTQGTGVNDYISITAGNGITINGSLITTVTSYWEWWYGWYYSPNCIYLHADSNGDGIGSFTQGANSTIQTIGTGSHGYIYVYAGDGITINGSLTTSGTDAGYIYLHADINGDGAGTFNQNQGSVIQTLGTGNNNYIYIYAGDGITLNSSVTTSGTDNNYIYLYADVNGDGVGTFTQNIGSTIATTGAGSSNYIYIYAGDGIALNGSLTTSGTDAGYIYLHADVNGDGVGTFTQNIGSTISTTGTGSSNYIYIYGNGITLNSSVTTSGTDNNYIYLYADVNGDGVGTFTQNIGSTIATTGAGSSNYIYIYAGNGITLNDSVTTGGTDNNYIYLYADSNNDGIGTFAQASSSTIQTTGTGSSNYIYIYGNGITLNSSVTTSGTDNNYIYLYADLNGDGIGSFVQNAGSTIATTATGSSNYIYIYAGDGISLGGPITTSGTDGNYIYLYADLNGDGIGSFVQNAGSTIATTGTGSSSYIYIYGNGITLNSSVTTSGTDNNYIYLHADVNGDGVGTFTQNVGSTIATNGTGSSNYVSIYSNDVVLNGSIGADTVYLYAIQNNNILTSGNTTFNNLVFYGGNGEWILQDALTVNDNLSLGNGILNLNGNNLTLAQGSVFSNDGTLKLLNTENLINFTNDTDSGIVEYYGTGTYDSLKAGNNYYNLVFSGEGTYAINNVLDVNGDLTINAGTLDTGSYGVNIGGSFTNSASFTSSGIITFNATAAGKTITAGQAATFNDLVFDGVGGEWTLEDDLYLNGNLSVNNGKVIQAADITLTLNGDLTLGSNAKWQKADGSSVIFSPEGTKSWTDNTPSGQDLGAVYVQAGSSTLNIIGSVKCNSLFIDTGHTVVMTENSSLSLTGTGTPLTGTGILDTATYTPNTIQYTGIGTTNITAAGPVSAYYNLVLNGSSFGAVGTLILAEGNSSFWMAAVIDTVNGYAYFGTDTSTGIVVKVRLSDFTEVGVLTLEPDEYYLASAVIDPNAGFAYFGTDSQPAKIIKIDLASFTRVDAITTENNEYCFETAIIDTTHGYAYFGAGVSLNNGYWWSAEIVKINLSSFTRVGTVILDNTVADWLSAAVIDTVNGFAYFGTCNYYSQDKIVKINIDPNNFSFVDAVNLEPVDGYVYGAAVIDTDNGFAYFGNNNAPGSIVKININPNNFSRVGATILPDDEYYLSSAVIDTANGYAYFGTAEYGPADKIIKVDLATFSRVGSITVEPNSNLWTAVMDPDNGYAYFGTYNWWGAPGEIIKISLREPTGTAIFGTDINQTVQVNGDLTVNGFIVDVDTFDPAITVKGNLTLNGVSRWQKSDLAALIFSPTGTKTFTDNTQDTQDLGAVLISGGTDSPTIELATPMKATSLGIASGHTLDLSGKNLTLAEGASFSNDGTLKLFGSETLTGFTNDTDSGTVEYYGTEIYPNLAAGNTYYNLLISGSGSFTADSSLQVNDDFTQSSGTFISSDPINNAFSVEGSFSLISGIFHRFTGSGTDIDPYLIYDVYGLQAMKGYLSSYFELAQDIDASGTSGWNWDGTQYSGFAPIGTGWWNLFTGTFDGDNHIITGLYINRPSSAYIGLFGTTGTDSEIKNVGLINATIRGLYNVGGLAGYNYCGTISNSYASGGSIGGDWEVGSLVGWNYGAISDSYASASVIGNSGDVGGLVGWNDSNGIITNSYATGSVSGDRYYLGGLVGWNDGSISDSYATGNVAGYYEIGGLVGANWGGTITNSYATGSVSGNYYPGGLVGYNDGPITNSYATGNVSGDYRVGGLVGENGDNITNSYSTGNVSGTNYVGGLVGCNYDTITNSYAIGIVNGTTYLGGLVGDNSGTINNSYWDIQTSGQATSNGGEGKTTQEMMNAGTYSGWDFAVVGDGTIGNWIMAGYPHLQMEWSTIITNVYQLQMMSMNLAAAYTLANDIDVSETNTWNWDGSKYLGFAPIGNDTTPFTGTFEGAGYTLFNLYIYRSSFVGLFGYVGNAAQISNVNLVNIAISGSGGNYSPVSNLGGLAGYNSGTISNSSVTGSISGFTGWQSSVSNLGGLAGYNSGTITNSYTIGSVLAGLGNHSSTSQQGGLVGYNSGTITNSYASADLLVAIANGYNGLYKLGGLVGYNTGIISQSYASGNLDLNLTGQYIAGGISVNDIGGLTGNNSGTISNSYATGNVSVNVPSKSSVINLGGLVGNNSNLINNSYSKGSVSGSVGWYQSVLNNLGGFVGQNNSGIYTSNFWLKTETHNATLQDTGNNGDIIGITSANDTQIKQQATYEGWNFTSLWLIDENQSYPYFGSQVWTWDGEGDGTSWIDPSNWDKDSGYPNGPDKKVVIDTGSQTIYTPSGYSLNLGKLILGSGYSGILTLGNNLTLNTGALQGNLSIANSSSLSAGVNSLTIGGNFTNNATFTSSGTVTFNATTSGNTITSGGASFNNLVFNGIGGEWSLQDTLDVDGNLTISAGTLTAGINSVNIGGSFANSGTFTSSGIVTFDAITTGNTISIGNATFNNIAFDGVGGEWILANTLTISGSLSQSANCTIKGTVIQIYANNGIIINGNLTTTGTNSGYINLNADYDNNGTGIFSQAAGSTISTTGTGSGNYIRIYSGNGITLNGSLTTSGTNNNYIYLNADYDNNGTGIFSQAAGSTISTTGTGSGNYIQIYAGNGITLNNLITTSGTDNNYIYLHADVNGDGVGSFVQNNTVLPITTIATNCTGSSNYIQIYAGNGITLNGSVTTSGTDNNYIYLYADVNGDGVGTFTQNVGSTIQTTSIGSSNYIYIYGGEAVTIDGSLSTSGTSGSNNIQLYAYYNRDSVITINGLINVSADTLYIGTSGNLVLNPDADITSISHSISLDNSWVNNGASLNMGSGTVTINVNEFGNSITSGGASFDILNLNNSGVVTLLDPLVVNGTLTINGGIITLNDNDNDLTVNGNLNIASGTLDLNGNSLTMAGTSVFSNNGILKLLNTKALTGFTNDLDSGTVEYYGSDTYDSLKAGNSYYNLVFSGTGIYTLNDDLIISGSFTNNASFIHLGTITFNAVTAGNTITVGDASLNNLVFDGISGQWTLQDNLIVSGNLTVNNGKIIQDADTTLTLNGDLTLGSNAKWQKADDSNVIFSPPGISTWTDNTTSGQDLGAVYVQGGSDNPNLNIAGNVKCASLFINTDHTVTMTQDSSLSLTGTGTPLTGTGILDTATYTPNTIQYTGAGTTSITAAGPLSAYYNLILNGSPFAKSDTLTVAEENSRFLQAAVIDIAHGYAYFGTYNNLGIVVKVRLSDFTEVGVLTLEADETYLSSAIIDVNAGFAYFGTDNNPGKIIKIDLTNFTRVDAITTENNEYCFETAIIDTTHGYAYFGAGVSLNNGYWWSAEIVKINLSSFTRVGTVILDNTVADWLSAAVIDTVNGYAYLGTCNYYSQDKIVKINIDPNNFSVADFITLEPGEYFYGTVAVIDTVNNFAYFGTETNPSKIIKINIDPSNFSRVDTITLPDDEYYLVSAVIDTANGYAYFGTETNPGKIIKVNIAPDSFSRVDAITLEENEGYLYTAVIDPANSNAYFGTYNWWGDPGKIIKVGLSMPTAILGTGLGQTLTVNGDLTVNNYADANTFDPAIVLKGNLILASSSRWQKSDSATLTFSPQGTKAFTDNTQDTQDLGAVLISGGTDSPTIELATPMKATSLGIASGHTLDLSGKNLTLAEGASFSNDGTLKLFGSETLTGFTNDTDSGTVEYYGTEIYPNLAAGNTYYNLLISGSGSFTADSSLQVNDDFTQSSGTFISSDPINNAFSVEGSFSLIGGTFNRFTGSGTPEAPYLIYDIYGLQAMQCNLAAYYTLFNDIEASSTLNWNTGEGFMPVGNYDTGAFTGTFDGDNHTISNLYINRPSSAYIGLFGTTGTDSEIKNVRLINATIRGLYNVGGLAGYNYCGAISNSYATGGSIGGDWEVGSLVGWNYGAISDSYASASVIGNSGDVGGLVGWNDSNGTIINSYATGSVSGNGCWGIGGLVGWNDGSISDSYATGSVSDGRRGRGMGGLVGRNNGPITNSYATGNLSGEGEIGGLVGEHRGNITNSYATGTVSGGDCIAGLVGHNNGGTITNSYATGSVSGNYYPGGLVGYNDGPITNSYATGNVSGDYRVGGLVGENGDNITNSYSTGNVTGDEEVGGLVGYNYGPITNSYATGNVSGDYRVGGLVGYTYHGTTGTITNSHYNIDTVLINGDHYVTIGGMYNAQFVNWVVNKTLNITDYFTANREGYYEIGSIADLKNFLGFAGSGLKFQLVADIDLSSEPNFYIPYLSVQEFDGNNRTISNLNINMPSFLAQDIGFFGYMAEGEIKNLGLINVNINVNITSDNDTVGGLVGNNAGTITNSYATGRITNSGTWGNAGGLVGRNQGTVTNSYSSADVSGYNVGGLIGRSSGGGTVINSYATGSVSGNGRVGGLVGASYWMSTITNSYATGIVSGTWIVGGLVGRSDWTTVTNSYWDTETSGQATSAGGEGKTTQEMMNPATYSGWDFAVTGSGVSGDWIMAGYPHLQIEHTTTITNVVQLQLMAVNLTTDYTLANDIDASATQNWNAGAGFAPIGSSYYSLFTGTFEGNDHIISNLYINRPDTSFVGLFGFIGGSNCQISNVGLWNVTITGGNSYVGALVGRNGEWRWYSGSGWEGGLITNSYSTGSVSGGGMVGGLVGRNEGMVTNSYSTATVNGTDYAIGGLVGDNYPGTITDSYATGDVNGADYTGGLVGENWGGTITDSYASGDVTWNGRYGYGVGGLVGSNRDDGTVTNSYATGDVNGDDYVGGLVGENDGTITDSYFTGGSVTGGTGHYGGVGGLVGANIYGGTITNSHYNIDTVLINDSHYISIGGMYNAQFTNWVVEKTLNITDYFTANNEGYYQIGSIADLKNFLGFAGSGLKFQLTQDIDLSSEPNFYIPYLSVQEFDGNNRTISNLNIDMPFVPEQLGFFGYVAEGEIKNLGLINVNISISSASGPSVGGLAGENWSGTITNCYSTGSINNNGSNTGGLVGYNRGTITNSYSTANVISGGNSVGGLIGISSGAVTNSYATGTVSGNNGVGGLMGVNWGGGTITNSYAAGSVSGTWCVGGLVGSMSSSSYWGQMSAISDSYATGDVTGAYGVGGLMGVNWRGGAITNSYSTGTVTGSGYWYGVGGLIGSNDGPITNSYSISDVRGDYSVGGLIGSNGGGITNSYTTGSVSGGDCVGGLAGYNSGPITNSYSIGSVSGSNYVGGLLGYNDGVINNSFWNTQASGTDNGVGAGDSSGLTGKTTAEMKQQDTFVDWNFTEGWAIDESYSYPYLQYQVWTWDADGDGASWTDPLNWNRDLGYPNNKSDKVVINSGSANITTASGSSLTVGAVTLGNDFSGSLKLENSFALDNTASLSGRLIISGSLGVFDLNGNNLSISGTFSNEGTLKLFGSEVLTGFTNDTDSGSVEYTGSSAYSLIAGDTYYNLTISGSGAFIAAESLDVNHNFSQTNGTFTAPSGNFYVGNDFSHTGGTFIHNNGTVILDAEGSVRLSGSTIFYNLTRISSGTQLVFETGSTQTIISTLTLKGIPGEHLVLRSSSRGTQWKIDPQGVRDIAYVNVQDSNNISAGAINPIGSLDNDNNTNWFPVVAVTVTSTQIEQATNATNTATTSVTQIVVATITTLLQPEIISSLPELVSLGSGGNLVLVTKVSAPAAPREAAQPTQETKPVVEEKAKPVEEAKPTEKQAESKEEAKSEKKETAQEEAKAEKYGFDYSLHEEEGTEVKSKYRKHYIAGKYRTVVIVFEGRVVVNPYDEKGLKEKGVATLTEGQAASSEGKI